MRISLFLAALLGAVVMREAKAEFVGDIVLAPAGCQASGLCRLVEDFGYIDPAKVGWQAKAGLMTDGASIPSWAQPFIGSPWENAFIKAAVLHDHYCVRTVRERTQTHRMFYYALVESGVSKAKASVMYYAVLVGSHMWTKPMKGKTCQGVPNCIQNVSSGLPTAPNASLKTNEVGELVLYWAPRFDDPNVLEDIRQASALIETDPTMSLEAVEALALRRHPNDVFLRNGDTIIYTPSPSPLETK